MQGWFAFKGWLTAATGLDHGALNVLTSLFLLILAGLFWRRPLSHLLPWLSVLAAALANELVTGFRDGIYDAAELAGSKQDLLLVMILPTALLVICRFAPQLILPRIQRQYIVPMDKNARRPDTVEGEFQELPKPQLRH